MTGVVIIDNFDSFVYNLYQYVGEQGVEVRVLRNNVSLAEIESQNPERLIISPGPGRPDDSGVSIEAIKYFSGKTPSNWSRLWSGDNSGRKASSRQDFDDKAQ
jgi:anthranilate/para-aminobenzoate synthase component II